jgi:HEAT repeat protein
MVQPTESRLEPEAAGVKPTRRYQTGLRALIALVACCAVVLWAARVLWQYRDPVLAEEREIEARAFRALQSGSTNGRVAAIQDLGRLSFSDNSTTIRSLTAMLGDENTEVRAAAAEALAEIGGRAVEAGTDAEPVGAAVTALIKSLKDANPRVRVAAAITLGYLASAKPAGDTDLLFGVPRLGGKIVAPVSTAAVTTPTDTHAVIAALARMLGDPDVNVRAGAVAALATASSMVDPPKALATILKDKSAENRRLTVEILANCRRGLDSWIPSLLEIAENDNDQSVRAASVFALDRSIAPPAVSAECVPDLIAGLESRDPKIRIAVANLLGRLWKHADDAIPALLRILTEPTGAIGNDEVNLAWAAAFALGKIAPGSPSAKRVITALTEVARSRDGIARLTAVSTLGQFREAAAPAIPVLIKLLREAGPVHAFDVERDSIRALGLIAPETRAADEVVTVLLPVLQSNSASNRAEAIETLQLFGPKAAIAIPRFRAMREDSDVFVKKAAARALFVLVEEGSP